MKLRYIVDIDIDEEDTEMELVLANDMKEFVENHEYGYIANSVHVKMQDEYCIKSEQRVKKVPAADVAEVRHGKWDNKCNCSVCGVYKFEGLDADVWADWDIDYCPNCGAKMN